MPLDRYIKHEYLHTLSLIIKDDSKVKQISKYMFTLFNSNHHHPVKPVTVLAARMTCPHTETVQHQGWPSPIRHQLHTVMETQEPFYSPDSLEFWFFDYMART